MERGFFAPVEFEQLMMLDTWTPDGRRIDADGFGTRTLPRTVFLLDHQSEGGHLGAKVAGRLDEVEVNGNVVSGRGLLLDDEVGRKAALYLDTKCITGNSVDLADVQAEMATYTPFGASEERMGTRFRKANLGATTIVSMGAFPDATSAISNFSMPAAGDLLHAAAFSSTSFKVATPTSQVLLTTEVDKSWFVGEQARRGAYPVTVEADGRVHGYLADWKTWHLSTAGRIRAPKGNGYGYFNASTVLTPDGAVSTGPLVIGGDHADLSNSWTEAIDFYAATSLAWADVHATDDKWGIRINGMVRPGTPIEAVHAGRASRLSGDWRRISNRMELIASLSCNTPAFPVARSFTSSDGQSGALVLLAPQQFAREANPADMAAVRARLAMANLEILGA